MSLKVGGLDPSLSSFGMCKGTVTGKKIEISEILLEQTLPTKLKGHYKNEDDLERAYKLLSAMVKFFKGCNYVAVELPVGSQTARAMTSYGITLGVVSALKRMGIPLIIVRANEVKEIAAGKNASKGDMIKWAMAKYPQLPWQYHAGKPQAKNEHVADAIASIHASIYTNEFKLININS